MLTIFVIGSMAMLQLFNNLYRNVFVNDVCLKYVQESVFVLFIFILCCVGSRMMKLFYFGDVEIFFIYRCF